MGIRRTKKLFSVVYMAFSVTFLICGCGRNTETNPIEEEKNEETIQQEESSDGAYIYHDVLAQYRDMVQNSFYTELLGTDRYDKSFGEDIGLEIRTHEQNIYYALYDIDGNGTEELIIAGGEKDSPWNYGLYGFDGTKVVPVFPEMDFGYRTNFTLYEDGIIEVFYSGSAAESGVDFYKIGEDGFTAELTDSFAAVGKLVGEEPVFTYFQKENEITEEEYNTCIHNYEIPLTIKLDWAEIN